MSWLIDRYAAVFEKWDREASDREDPEWLALSSAERGRVQAEFFAAELAKIPVTR